MINLFIAFTILSVYRYNKLEKEFAEYVSNDVVDDTYAVENKRLKQEIKILQEDLDDCYTTLDSLKQIKQQIII